MIFNLKSLFHFYLINLVITNSEAIFFFNCPYSIKKSHNYYYNNNKIISNILIFKEENFKK